MINGHFRGLPCDLAFRSWRLVFSVNVKEGTPIVILTNHNVVLMNVFIYAVKENIHIDVIPSFFKSYWRPYYGMICDAFIPHWSLVEMKVKTLDSKTLVSWFHGDDGLSLLHVQSCTQSKDGEDDELEVDTVSDRYFCLAVVTVIL